VCWGNEGGSRWSWRRRFFVWEENSFANMLVELEGFVHSHEDDRWCWRLEDNGAFSVSSMYKKLDREGGVDSDLGVMERRVFTCIWKSPAPSKVVAFSWKLLYDRIPTRRNLALRNVLPPDVPLLCALCENSEESSTHLFLHCQVASMVWEWLMRWLNGSFITPPNLFNHWECWSDLAVNKRVRKGYYLIWHASVWLLWKARNDKIFNNVVCDADSIVEEVKVLSWRWSLLRMNIPSCLFYEWCWDPVDCLLHQRA